MEKIRVLVEQIKPISVVSIIGNRIIDGNHRCEGYMKVIENAN